jgi:hypothetical protein
MAVSLGRSQSSPLTGISNDGIRNVTVTNEAESVDITCRQNAADGYRAFETTFVNPTFEIETLDLGSLSVGSVVGTDYEVTNIQENQPLDDVISYTITVKRKAT